ncbi:MAG: DUF2058 family protein [Myxococcaceae bacterium]|nr:DUF2058 family protein [Myxococcaceae bacterium]
MQSLKDKLLKAGLVTEEAAKKADADKQATAQRAPRREDRPRRDERPPRDDRPVARAEPPVSSSARLPKFAPLSGSKEASRQQAKKQLELDRTIREKVLGAQVVKAVGDTPFYFVTRKNKLRRLELSAEQAQGLETGTLAIVERPDPDQIEHALVPAAVARELMALHPKVVRFLKAPDAAVGFLSDAEITARAHEATGPETHEAHDEPDTGGAVDSEAPPEAAAPAETWITIKRAPKP